MIEITENLLTLRSYAKIEDEFATEKDKRKAYQIFILSAIGSVALTVAMYVIAIMF